MLRTSISTLLTVIIILSCNSAHPQAGTPYDDRYYEHVRDFVRFVIRSGQDSLEFWLEDSVTLRTYPDGYDRCLKDTTTFNAEERKQIRAWTRHPPFTVWTTELAGDARLRPH